MKSLMKKFFSALMLTASLGVFFSGPSQATIIGNLNDGANHTSGVGGYWSLFVNAGDNVLVTARRLDPFDIWAWANNGANGSGTSFGAGDDELPPFVGGPWGDPQFSFIAATTGEYSIGVAFCCSIIEGQQFSYFVSATGATGTDPNAVPIPGTLLLVGLGLGVLRLSRRKAV